VTDSDERPDRPTFEGQVVFKGDFRTDDDPTRLVDLLGELCSRGAAAARRGGETVRRRE